jgi:hypothetical protein
MKTAFVANMPVATLDVKELLGDEFRRQHQELRPGMALAPGGYYRTVEIEHPEPLAEIVIARFRALGFTKASR